MSFRSGYRKFLQDPDRVGSVSTALSHLGGGLLAASSPSLDPGHYGRTLGQAMQTVGPAMQQAQFNRDRGRLTTQALEEAERKKAERERQRIAYEGLIGGGPIDAPTALARGGGPTPEAAGLLGTSAPGLLGDLTPTQRGALGVLGPEAGASVLAQQAFQPPTAKYENVDSPYGRGGYGQRNTLTGQISGYQKPKDASGGPFEGTAMDAQALNVLLGGDPNSDVYAAAYAHYGQPKVSIDPTTGQIVTTRPDMSPYRSPASQAPQTPQPEPLATPAVTTTAVPGATVTRTSGPSTGKFSETQYVSALYADRMTDSGAVLDALDSEGTAFWANVKNAVPGGNFFQSSEYQQYDQARRDFINATLRRESGAVISDDEFDNANKQYFPQPGDKPQVIAQKRRNRKTAIEGISRAAGPSYEPKSPADYNKPLPTPPPGFELVR